MPKSLWQALAETPPFDHAARNPQYGLLGTREGSPEPADSSFQRAWDSVRNAPIVPADQSGIAEKIYSTLGGLLPEWSAPALAAAKKYAVDPFDAAAVWGGTQGRDAVPWAAAAINPDDDAAGNDLNETHEQFLARGRRYIHDKHPIVGGALEGVGEMVGSTLADPRNWPFFLSGEAGGAPQELMSRGFGAMMLHSALNNVPAIADAIQRGDYEEASRLATMTALGGAMAKHGLEAKPRAVGEGLRGGETMEPKPAGSPPEGAQEAPAAAAPMEKSPMGAAPIREPAPAPLLAAGDVVRRPLGAGENAALAQRGLAVDPESGRVVEGTEATATPVEERQVAGPSEEDGLVRSRGLARELRKPERTSSGLPRPEKPGEGSALGMEVEEVPLVSGIATFLTLNDKAMEFVRYLHGRSVGGLAIGRRKIPGMVNELRSLAPEYKNQEATAKVENLANQFEEMAKKNGDAGIPLVLADKNLFERFKTVSEELFHSMLQTKVGRGETLAGVKLGELLKNEQSRKFIKDFQKNYLEEVNEKIAEDAKSLENFKKEYELKTGQLATVVPDPPIKMGLHEAAAEAMAKSWAGEHGRYALSDARTEAFSEHYFRTLPREALQDAVKLRDALKTYGSQVLRLPAETIKSFAESPVQRALDRVLNERPPRGPGSTGEAGGPARPLGWSGPPGGRASHGGGNRASLGMDTESPSENVSPAQAVSPNALPLLFRVAGRTAMRRAGGVAPFLRLIRGRGAREQRG